MFIHHKIIKSANKHQNVFIWVHLFNIGGDYLYIMRTWYLEFILTSLAIVTNYYIKNNIMKLKYVRMHAHTHRLYSEMNLVWHGRVIKITKNASLHMPCKKIIINHLSLWNILFHSEYDLLIESWLHFTRSLEAGQSDSRK